MYCTYFGLKERPFTLTPNPDFIFLGKAHQEAFAHLLYGIDQKAGFIALTGEVGAGKTTVIRTLLTRLTPETHATALILNPMLSSLGLLKTINREFGISDSGEEPAELVETLNKFLLQQKAAHKTVVLVIDEAQDMEPGVLEQVRLLSNLETSTEKLIQIILVGQPELETLLSRSELRQLNQRITVRYHLTPMDAADTRDYIAHRLRVAGGTPEMIRFSTGAVQAIHRFAGGLPRLVNAVADRCLLIGYTAESRQIEAPQARQAICEVAPSEGRRRNQRRTRMLAATVIALLLGATMLAGMIYTRPAAAPPVAAAVPQQTVTPLASLLKRLDEGRSSQEAYRTILKAWNIVPPAPALPDSSLERSLKQAGLDTFRYTGNLGGLSRIGYPAILELSLPNNQKRYLVFGGLSSEQALVATESGSLTGVSAPSIEQLWTGRAIIPWKNVLGLPVPVPYATNNSQRDLLARLLVSARAWPPNQPVITERAVRDAVKTFQHSQGLEAAGVAGGQTLLLLYRQAPDFKAPVLKKAEKTEP